MTNELPLLVPSRRQCRSRREIDPKHLIRGEQTRNLNGNCIFLACAEGRGYHLFQQEEIFL